MRLVKHKFGEFTLVTGLGTGKHVYIGTQPRPDRRALDCRFACWRGSVAELFATLLASMGT